MGGPRNHGVGGRFFGEGLNVGMLFVGFEVEVAQEVDGLEVFASAELVGNPFALLARVVEIEHGSDGVHAQAVGVIFVQPEHGARHQEAAHFRAAVVEDHRLPVGMEALARVGVLEQMRAVEEGEAVAVGREVRRHPVENHGDAVLVQVVDQIHEILRRAVTRRGSEIARRLVSPGAVEGMLHDGQQFDVGESQLVHVVGEAGRDLAIGERAVVFFGDAHPGAEVHFVDRHGRVQRVGGATRFPRKAASFQV